MPSNKLDDVIEAIFNGLSNHAAATPSKTFTVEKAYIVETHLKDLPQAATDSGIVYVIANNIERAAHCHKIALIGDKRGMCRLRLRIILS